MLPPPSAHPTDPGDKTLSIFGTIYYGSALAGAQLILLEQGLYEGDWGAFGAFVAAPVGGLVAGCLALALRLGALFVHSKVMGRRFDALDPPVQIPAAVEVEDEPTTVDEPGIARDIGKFF